jgi:hypothetical protein
MAARKGQQEQDPQGRSPRTEQPKWTARVRQQEQDSLDRTAKKAGKPGKNNYFG